MATAHDLAHSKLKTHNQSVALFSRTSLGAAEMENKVYIIDQAKDLLDSSR